MVTVISTGEQMIELKTDIVLTHMVFNWQVWTPHFQTTESAEQLKTDKLVNNVTDCNISIKGTCIRYYSQLGLDIWNMKQVQS